MINSTMFFYSFAFSFFNFNFRFRRYNGVHLSCPYVPRPMKSSTFTDVSEGKNKSIFSIHCG